MIVFFSCKKNSGNTTTDDTGAFEMSTSAAATDNLFNDTYDVLGLTVSSNSSLNARVAVGGRADGVDSVPGCTSVTIVPADTNTYPKTVTVNFGTGCTGWYGILRSGSITYTLSGKLKNPGTTVTAAYNNYKVNGYKIEGSYSLTNNSSISNGVMLTSTVTGGKVTYPDGTTWYSYSGNRTIKQTGGIGSLNYTDYVFSITGAHSYASYKGNTLTDSVTSPLIKQASCQYISSGTVAFTFNGSIKGTLDYGSGTCDNLATLSIGTQSKSIVLPR